MTASSTAERPPLSKVAREGAKRALRTYGVVTSGLRAEPDFLVIGGKRCGTTSLFRNLARHPDVLSLFPAPEQIKGAHFFDTNYDKGLSWYRSHFPTSARLALARRAAGRSKVVGEASPYYLFHPHAARRAAAAVPRAKLIVLLRNPAERAYSHYRERVRHGAESLTFEAALDREDERLAGEEEQMLADESYVSFAHEHLSYFRQGEYALALERWLSWFPRDSFLFVRSEDLFADPEPAYETVTDFLGLSPLPSETFEKHNYHPGSPMEPRTRAQLIERYRAANDRLAALIDFDVRSWT